MNIAKHTTYAVVTAVLLFGALLWGQSAFAQRIQVRLEVDRRIADVGQPVDITVDIVLDGMANYEQYVPPVMSGLQMTAGGQSSQYLTSFNGRVSRRESYSYSAVPVRAGQARIGPAKVRVAGKEYRSNTVSLTVNKGSGTPSIPVIPESDDSITDNDGEPVPSVFIACEVTPKTAVLGQQVVATWRLYSEVGFRRPQIVEAAKTDGFWVEELDVPRPNSIRTKVIAGREFAVLTLQRSALFPQQVGTATITPLKLRMAFFTNVYTGASDPVTVPVAPLPTAGKPVDFPQWNVGQFQIAATLSSGKGSVGEALKLTLVSRGSGNIRQLALPSLPELPGFKTYDPQIREQLDKGDVLAGEKIAEYLLVPKQAGRLRIPALTLHYFDPNANAYRSAVTKSLVFEATGASNTAAGTGIVSDTTKQRNVLGPDIRPPQHTRSLNPNVRRQPVGTFRLVLLAIPLALFFFVLGAERVRDRFRKPTDRARERAVVKQVRQQLKIAESIRANPDGQPFYVALAAALREQLRHSLAVAIDGVTRAELREQLRRNGNTEETIAALLALLDQCDAARFAPGSDSPSQRDEALQRTRDLVQRMGRVHPKRKAGAA